MRRVTKWVALAMVLLAALMAIGYGGFGCACAAPEPGTPTGLEMSSTYRVEAGAPLELDVKILWAGSHDENDDAIVRSNFKWSVETAVQSVTVSFPSEGVFTATTPGVYTVTVSTGDLSATTTVYVTEAKLTTTTETESTTTETLQ
jgi:hypothetical protein